MKKNLFLIFSLLFICLIINTGNVSAKDYADSMLCEYNFSDEGIKFQFNLYSKTGGDDYKAKDTWIKIDGFWVNGHSVVQARYWPSKLGSFSDNSNWANFTTRKTCNKYAAIAKIDGEYNVVLFDDSTKKYVIYSGSNYKKAYGVKVTKNYKSNNNPLKQEFVGNLTCGNSANDKEVIKFHKSLPTFTSRMYDFLKILTPVIIIITGMLDIIKAVTAQKEDDMKKAQKKLVNRLIAGSVVFLVFVIVEFVINFVAESDVYDAMNCVNCFLNGEMSNTGCVEAP